MTFSRPGSISSVTRRCRKPNCHCAQTKDPGHGPHRQLTQTIAGETVAQTLSSPTAVRKAEKEIAEFRRFQALAEELVELKQKICRLRPLVAEEASVVKKGGNASLMLIFNRLLLITSQRPVCAIRFIEAIRRQPPRRESQSCREP